MVQYGWVRQVFTVSQCDCLNLHQNRDADDEVWEGANWNEISESALWER